MLWINLVLNNVFVGNPKYAVPPKYKYVLLFRVIFLSGKTLSAQSVMQFLKGLSEEGSYSGKVFRRYELSQRNTKNNTIEFNLKTTQ